MSKDLVKIKRALISVSDKTGLDGFAKNLMQLNVEIISTGGTADFLRNIGVPVRDISDITKFPELMGGRVKTLHPKIHGGLLGLRENKDHALSMNIHNIPEIDLLVTNLYPFENISKTSKNVDEIIENIDVGGPALIRAGAKNFKYVSVLVDKDDYGKFFRELKENLGCTTEIFRRSLAEIAFARTAEYDGMIANWMNKVSKNRMPRRLIIAGKRRKSLRYGENPHQSACYYQTHSEQDILSACTIHQGKELSYNNINDIYSAIEFVREFEHESRCLAVIIKHTNMCGVALRDTPMEAYLAAFDCDRISAFGGIIAFNVNIDKKTAEEICKTFTEIVVAPSVSPDAANEFMKRKNLRLITVNKNYLRQTIYDNYKQVTGGVLVQEKDASVISETDLSVVSKRNPSQKEVEDMLFAWKVVKHVKSNAIVFVKNTATIGIGAGQMSRLESTKIAKRKAKEMVKIVGLEKNFLLGAVAASDAFFPFADNILELNKLGINAVIQPGGSLKDTDVVGAVNRFKMAMVFTRIRHFKH